MNSSAHEWNIDGKCARPRLHLDVRREVDLHGERREVANVRAIEEHGNPPLRAQRHAEEEVHRRPPIKIAGIVHVAMGASRVDLMREAIKSVVHLMRDALSDHPWPSRANQSHQRSSVVLRGHPRSSVYQDGDTPRDRQKVDIAEEDREPHDGSTEPSLVLAAADDWGGATPSPNRPGRHRHVDGAERLVVSGHELEEDLRGNQR